VVRNKARLVAQGYN